MIKRFLGSLLTLLAVVAMGITGVAHAQTTGFVPAPFVTTIAGVANYNQGAQYTNAINSCSSGIVTALGVNIGDNCAPTAASLYNLMDIAVDSYGNIYWADTGTSAGSTVQGTVGAITVAASVRVLYKGGAVAAGLIYGANSWNSAFTAVYANASAVQSSGVGKVFTVGGGYNTKLGSDTTKGQSCGGNSSYPTGYDTVGDGCPAAMTRISALHAITVDKYGNIYIASGQAGSSSIPVPHVIYAGGAQVANLITTINTSGTTGVTSAKVGYMYGLGFNPGIVTMGTYGDGGPVANAAITFPNGIAVDSKGNIFISDGRGNGNSAAFVSPSTYIGATFKQINFYGNNVREIFGVTNGYNLVGNVTTVAGETACGGDYVDTTGNHGLLTSRSVDQTNSPTSATSANNTLTSVVSYYPYVGTNVATNGNIIPYGCPTSSLAGSFTGSSPTYTMANYPPYSNYYDGDGGPATSGYINFPNSIVVDGNDNLYISENGSNRLRVVYSGTGTLPSAVYSAFGSSPVAGDIYTYGGNAPGGVGYCGGCTNAVTFPTGKLSGLPANSSSISFLVGSSNGANAWDAIGVDQAGSIYSFSPTYNVIWKVDPVTYTANHWGAGGNSNNYETLGAYCNGGTNGPKILDNYGSGCPALTSYSWPAGKIVFDSAGNAYMTNPGSGTAGTNVIQEYSLYESNNGTTAAPYSQFPATADSTTTSLWTAYESVYNPLAVPTGYVAGPTMAATNAVTLGLQGVSGSEFALSGTANTNSCTNSTVVNNQGICAFLVNFTPSHPGVRSGSITLTGSDSASGSSVTVTGTGPLVGVGTAADLAIDTGTTSTIGTGITPSGVAADLNGNVYVADSSANKVWKGATSGTTLTAKITGLNNPAQVAVDGAGNIYVANTGGNDVIETNAAGTVIATITGTTLMSTALSAPKGVAIDPYGNLYVADTGNNRVARVSTEGFVQPLQLMSSGTTALTLSSPSQLAFDVSGDLFILDSGNSRVVEVPTASSGGTSYAFVVTLDSGITPDGIALDAAGDIYVSTSAGNVLEYYPGAAAATPTLPGFSVLTGLTSPVGLAIDSNAQVFVADSAATGLTADLRSKGYTNFTASGSSNLTLNNVGNYPLTLTSTTGSVSGTNASAFTVAAASSGGCTTSALAAGGNCLETANFTSAGGGTYTASASFTSNAANAATVSLNGILTLPSQTITFTAPTTPVTYGASAATLSASSTSGLTVVFTIDGSSTTGACSVSGTTLNFTGTGNCVIDANQSGNGSYAAATQVQQTVVINKASQTITFTAPATPVTYGASAATLSASSTSSLTVAFTIDGSSTSGACSVSGTTLTFTGAGNCIIDANQVGNTNYAAATQVQQTVVINKATQTITGFNPPTTATYGSGTITLSATGGASGNAVTFSLISGPGSVTGSTLTITGVGTIVVAADQLGGTDYTAATEVQASIVVSKGSQTITGFNPPATATYGSGTITLSATGGASGNAVTFSLISGPGSVTGSTLTITGVGTIVVAADQLGGTDYTAATEVQASIVVSKGSQTITGFNPPTTATYGSGTITLSATGGASGNAVTFSLISGPGSVTGSTLTITGVGTIVVAANQAGNSDYNAATQATASIVVSNAGTTTTLNCTPTSVVPGQAVNCSATVAGSGGTPTGTVTFTSTSTGQTQGTLANATLSGGVATYYGLIWVGSDVVTAIYSGDSNFGGSTSNAVSVSNFSNTGKLQFNWPYVNWGQAVSYGASSGAWPVTVQNLTGATVNTPTITSSSANFVVTAGSCNGVGTLAVGASCSFSVVFTPTTGGSPSGTKITGTLTTSTTTSANYSNTLAESGIAQSSALTFNWPFLNFTPTVAVGATSSPWPVTLVNSSGTSTTVNSLSVSDASFVVSSDTCTGLALGAGASCTFNVIFSPVAADVASSGTNVISGATLTATGNSGAVTGTLSLGGWAATALGFNWPFLTFQGVSQGATGTNPWPVTVTNYSGSTLTGLSYTFTGGTNYQSGAFTITDPNNCFGNTLAAGASCVFNVLPSPQSSQSVGAYSATLVVSGTSGAATLSSYSLNVSGVANAGGLAINWNQDQQNGTSTIDFGPQNTKNVTAGPWPITVYNNTSSVQTLTLTPSLSQFTTDVTTLTNVPAGGSAVFNLYFTPTATTSYQGTLTVTGTGCTYSFNIWGGANK